MLLFSTALQHGFVVPFEPNYVAHVWECLVPPFQKERFVGILLPPGEPEPGFVQITFYKDGSVERAFTIAESGRTFFGLQETIFKSVTRIVYSGRSAADGVEPASAAEKIPLSLSSFKDGTVLGPADFFRHTGAFLI